MERLALKHRHKKEDDPMNDKYHDHGPTCNPEIALREYAKVEQQYRCLDDDLDDNVQK